MWSWCGCVWRRRRGHCAAPVPATFEPDARASAKAANRERRPELDRVPAKRACNQASDDTVFAPTLQESVFSSCERTMTFTAGESDAA